jgi:hypothetical protein
LETNRLCVLSYTRSGSTTCCTCELEVIIVHALPEACARHGCRAIPQMHAGCWVTWVDTAATCKSMRSIEDDMRCEARRSEPRFHQFGTLHKLSGMHLLISTHECAKCSFPIRIAISMRRQSQPGVKVLIGTLSWWFLLSTLVQDEGRWCIKRHKCDIRDETPAVKLSQQPSLGLLF